MYRDVYSVFDCNVGVEGVMKWIKINRGESPQGETILIKLKNGAIRQAWRKEDRCVEQDMKIDSLILPLQMKIYHYEFEDGSDVRESDIESWYDPSAKVCQ